MSDELLFPSQGVISTPSWSYLRGLGLPWFSLFSVHAYVLVMIQHGDITNRFDTITFSTFSSKNPFHNFYKFQNFKFCLYIFSSSGSSSTSLILQICWIPADLLGRIQEHGGETSNKNTISKQIISINCTVLSCVWYENYNILERRTNSYCLSSRGYSEHRDRKMIMRA